MFSAYDFGKNPKTNEQILELVKIKAIQRVAILIDGVFSSSEITTLKNSAVFLDLHLSLKKLTGAEKSRQGLIGRSVLFFLNFFSRKNSTKKVLSEWLRQIEKFQEIFGRYPDGLNSHEHIHFFPSYFPLAINLAKISGIKYIRFGEKGIIQEKHLISKILSVLWKINQKNFQKSGLNSSELVFSSDWTKKEEIEKYIHTDTEIIFHPERDEEYEILKNLKK